MTHIYPPQGYPPQGFPPPTQRRGMPWWAWTLIVLLVLGVLSCAGCIGGLAWIGASSPATHVYAGHEVPAAYRQTAIDHGLLEDGETVRFFYSDGLMGIESGYYLVTDRKLAVYAESWTPAANPIPFDQILDVSLARDTSFVNDSTLTVETETDYFTIPISSEKDLDIAFKDAVLEGMEAAR